jgi:hypothetical protein
MKTKKFFGNLFVGLANITCITAIFAIFSTTPGVIFDPEFLVPGLVIGGIGIFGLIGQILLNLNDNKKTDR